MLQSITHGQMDCIAEIARRIYNQTFPLLTRYLTYFENRNLVLRLLISERVSFRRKVNTLVRNHRIITRLTYQNILPSGYYPRSNSYSKRGLEIKCSCGVNVVVVVVVGVVVVVVVRWYGGVVVGGGGVNVVVV